MCIFYLEFLTNLPKSWTTNQASRMTRTQSQDSRFLLIFSSWVHDTSSTVNLKVVNWLPRVLADKLPFGIHQHRNKSNNPRPYLTGLSLSVCLSHLDMFLFLRKQKNSDVRARFRNSSTVASDSRKKLGSRSSRDLTAGELLPSPLWPVAAKRKKAVLQETKHAWLSLLNRGWKATMGSEGPCGSFAAPSPIWFLLPSSVMAMAGVSPFYTCSEGVND
jgi:hypothetical protein